MTKSQQRTKSQFLGLLTLTMAAYVFLDVPIRISGAFSFSAGVGMKNFLPVVFGMFFGPVGAAGGALGAFLAALFTGESWGEILSETLSVAALSLSSWAVWFALNREGNVRLEKWSKLGLFTAMVIGLSLIPAGITMLFLGAGLFVKTYLGYVLFGEFVGILVIILLGGIFCVEPILPPYAKSVPDASFTLIPGEDALNLANEALEEAAFRKKIPMKKVFETQSVIEELFIRIRKELPDSEVTGAVSFESTITMHIWFTGDKYNPLRLGKEEDEMDIVSLKLIRHRALRASFSHFGGTNSVHIVV